MAARLKPGSCSPAVSFPGKIEKNFPQGLDFPNEMCTIEHVSVYDPFFGNLAQRIWLDLRRFEDAKATDGGYLYIIKVSAKVSNRAIGVELSAL